jgi:hypothetical protein
MFSGEYLRRKFAHRQFKVWCFTHRGLRSKDVAKLKEKNYFGHFCGSLNHN